MIAGSGEELTLRAVAWLADARNLFGHPNVVMHRFAVLHRHCDTARRYFDKIEKTSLVNIVTAKCGRRSGKA
jgi:hypothetical protein